MKERGIIFSAPMVRALLDGTKTQTRRVIVPQPPCGCSYVINGAEDHALCYATEYGCDPSKRIWVPPTPRSIDHRLPCPYGGQGKRLWVKETFKVNTPPSGFIYRADKDIAHLLGKWKPAIFMPRTASRITLELTDVRVERLQDISPADCLAEGIRGEESAIGAFRQLWDSLRTGDATRHRWKHNPWVWVLEFRRLKP